MRLKNIVFCLLFVLVISSSCGHAIDKTRLDNQDMPSSALENPLKGLSKFLIIFKTPSVSKQETEKLKAVVETELKKYGTVNDLSTLVKEGEAFDFSKTSSDATLMYFIENVIELNGQETPLIRTSLNLSNRVTVSKTKQECFVYIWSNNCFSSADLKKNLNKIVQDTFSYQMKAFMTDYSSVNTDKPSFTFYLP